MTAVPVPEQTAVLERMPHRPPMRLVSRLLEAEVSTSTFMAEAEVNTASPFWSADNGLDCLALAEMMAQTFAAGSALSATGEPVPGFLVGLREVQFHGQAHQGDHLRIRVRAENRIGAFVICHGQVCRVADDHAETPLVSGQFRLFVPEKGAV